MWRNRYLNESSCLHRACTAHISVKQYFHLIFKKQCPLSGKSTDLSLWTQGAFTANLFSKLWCIFKSSLFFILAGVKPNIWPRPIQMDGLRLVPVRLWYILFGFICKQSNHRILWELICDFILIMCICLNKQAATVLLRSNVSALCAWQ